MTYFSLHISRICKDLQEINNTISKNPIKREINIELYNRIFEDLFLFLE
tara:strand:+ start:1131 stop:1277 length:147 start_codon:yes stop_codon:yes gene_type:complete